MTQFDFQPFEEGQDPTNPQPQRAFSPQNQGFSDPISEPVLPPEFVRPVPQTPPSAPAKYQAPPKLPAPDEQEAWFHSEVEESPEKHTDSFI